MAREQRFASAAMGWYLIAASCSGGGEGGAPIITPPPPASPLTLLVTPNGQRTTVQAGATAAPGAVNITLGGDGATTAAWTAQARTPRTVLEGSGGVGSGLLRWQRQTAALTAGLWIDTIFVQTTDGSRTALVVDTVVVTAAPVPLSATLTPASRRTTIQEGNPAPADSALFAIAGTGAETAPWQVAARRQYTRLAVSSGTGSAMLRWTRGAPLPAAGTWVDTITVTWSPGPPLTLVDTLVVLPATPPPTTVLPDLGLNGSFRGRRLLPDGDLWNRPVDTAQVDPNSAAILGAIGLTKGLHPDFGADYNGGPFGIPYVVVADTTTRSNVLFDYAAESDVGPYPIPRNPPIEPSSDRHLLMVTQNEFRLYEIFALNGGPGAWTGGSGAIWDLTNGTTRPAGWTSADAAGLPILPGLVRYDEVVEQGAIEHALRFTVVRTRRAYLAPARHWASSSTNALYAPMGMRVRLRANFDISSYPPHAQVILRALKRYGMIVADNGSDFFLSGTADARWNDTVISTLKQVRVGDFEVVRMDGVVTP